MIQKTRNPQDVMSRYQVLLLHRGSPNESPQWFTPAEAARVLSLSTQRVRQLVTQNRLPALRTRQGPYLPAAAVLAIAKMGQGEAAVAKPGGAAGFGRPMNVKSFVRKMV